MTLTRRTARFGELAAAFEAHLATAGVNIGADVIDQILRNRIDATADLMRVSPRTALGYAPDDLPNILTKTVLQAIAPGAGESRHLRSIT